MNSKRSNNVRNKAPEKVDDFKLIHGIGKAIERHLQTAGIYTYSQLASLSSEEIAGLLPNVAGLNSEKIASLDWSRQADKLAAKTEHSHSFTTVSNKERRQHYSTYTVELLLDEENRIRRTRVVHVQSGKESTWAGWLPTQLENLILQGIGPSPKNKHQMNQADRSTLMDGQVQLQDILVIREENRTATRMLRYGQPYSLQILLDLTDVFKAGNNSICYEATVYAHDLRNQFRETIGIASGAIERTSNSDIRLPGKSLNRGIYRLEAVIVFSPQVDINPGSSLMGMLEGNVLQVY